jgi:hypothetical protein
LDFERSVARLRHKRDVRIQVTPNALGASQTTGPLFPFRWVETRQFSLD